MRTNELKYKKINKNKLLDYGFILNNNEFIYSKNIMNDEFKVYVNIKDNKINSKVIDNLYNEEYLLVDIESLTGEFVGKVREEYEKIIKDIITKCTTKEIYSNKQTKEIIKYVKKTYKCDLEFLWKKSPCNSILRNKKTKKWFGVLMIIPEKKLGIDSDKECEIINLRYNSSQIKDIIDNKVIFPGWHMNKKNWITIKLDNLIDINIIYSLIDNSYYIS